MPYIPECLVYDIIDIHSRWNSHEINYIHSMEFHGHVVHMKQRIPIYGISLVLNDYISNW